MRTVLSLTTLIVSGTLAIDTASAPGNLNTLGKQKALFPISLHPNIVCRYLLAITERIQV
jgi:hypothetical protein